MFKKLARRFIALLIWSPFAWLIGDKLFGWKHDFILWWLPAFVASYFLSFAFDGIEWLLRQLTQTGADSTSKKVRDG